jgi:hypothetical protein
MGFKRTGKRVYCTSTIEASFGRGILHRDCCAMSFDSIPGRDSCSGYDTQPRERVRFVLRLYQHLPVPFTFEKNKWKENLGKVQRFQTRLRFNIPEKPREL